MKLTNQELELVTKEIVEEIVDMVYADGTPKIRKSLDELGLTKEIPDFVENPYDFSYTVTLNTTEIRRIAIRNRRRGKSRKSRKFLLSGLLIAFWFLRRIWLR